MREIIIKECSGMTYHCHSDLSYTSFSTGLCFRGTLKEVNIKPCDIIGENPLTLEMVGEVV